MGVSDRRELLPSGRVRLSEQFVWIAALFRDEEDEP